MRSMAGGNEIGSHSWAAFGPREVERQWEVMGVVENSFPLLMGAFLLFHLVRGLCGSSLTRKRRGVRVPQRPPIPYAHRPDIRTTAMHACFDGSSRYFEPACR
jgi:hypothetical protein